MRKKMIVIIIGVVFVIGIFIGGIVVYLWKNKKPMSKLDEIAYFNEFHGFKLKIPKEWGGKFFIREKENTVSFYYLPIKSDLPHDIFSITVYSKKEWEKELKERKEMEEKGLAPGCCPKVFAEDSEKGRIFEYNRAIDVPYVDQIDIDEFMEMHNDVEKIIDSFSIE